MRTFTLTIESAPDSHGRQTFRLDWMQGERKRTQYFKAVVAEHVRQLKEDGHVVTVVEQIRRG